MNALGANTVYNHADYRLMSRRALEGLAEFSEVNLFLRGIVPMIGYPSDVVYYDRKERAAGESKYPLKNDAGFCDRGHHFAEHKADPDDYVHGNCGIFWSVLDSLSGRWLISSGAIRSPAGRA